MNERLLNKKQVAASFSRAAKTYDRQAELQKQVAEELVDKLEFITYTPELILDVGAGTGFLRKSLQKRFKSARLILSDIAEGMLKQAKSNDRRFFSRSSYACGDMEALPFKSDSVDMLISSLAIQWCNDLDQVMNEFFRVLKPGGLLMFATLGPDSLRELRESWRSIDASEHVNTFLDMHDIGDCMVRTGFNGPVMDADIYTLTYESPLQVMKDLKALGSNNRLQSRRRDLVGKSTLQAVMANYETYRRDGVIPASYEVVFGHAWCPENKQYKSMDGDVRIPLSTIGRAKEHGI